MFDAKRQTLLIDGDDTLWKAQVLYRRAERTFRERLASALGVSTGAIQAKFDETNGALAASMGFQEQRYPLAMEQTYEYFARQQEVALDPAQQAAIRAIGESVFALTPEPMEGASEVISSLAERYNLIFYSGGDEALQRGRLDHLGLARFFSGIRVVRQKNEDELRKLLADASLTPQNTWMIGNSPRFDIGPALRLGLRAIWLYSELWDDEKEELIPRNGRGGPALYATVFTLKEIPPMLNSFPTGDQTDPRLDLYQAVIEDQSHTSARRQNLTNVFIGLNTVALSGLAFLLLSLKRDDAMYFDIAAGLLITISAYFINRIYRMAMKKYDHTITVYAVYLRGIEDSFKDDLSVRVNGAKELHPGVMNVLGDLRGIDKKKLQRRSVIDIIVYLVSSVWHWMWQPVVAIVRKMRALWSRLRQVPGSQSPKYARYAPVLGYDDDEWSDEGVKEFAKAVKYRVEGTLADGFVKFFGWATIVILGILVIALAGVFRGVTPWSPLHEWVAPWLPFQF